MVLERIMAPDPRSPWQTALRLEYVTVVYTVLEALASLAFGIVAGSVALTGFGLDSIIETLSGLVLIWRLRRHGQVSVDQETGAEKLAERLVAASFILIGVYVLYEAVDRLARGSVVEPSVPGVAIAFLSLIIMPVLAWRKRVISREIGSRALLADAKETAVCGFLSAALLLGLLANYLFGFWQADPLAGIVIAIFLFHEGYETWCSSCGGCECTEG